MLRSRTKSYIPDRLRQMLRWLRLRLNLFFSKPSAHRKQFRYNVKAVRGTDGQHTFGSYFDNQIFSQDSRFVVYNAVRPGDTVSNVVVESHETRKLIASFPTRAFNWQQGAMAVWLGRSDRIAYNALYDNGQIVRTVIANPFTKEIEVTPFSASDFSRDGEIAVGIDFHVWALHSPQYGYADLPKAKANSHTSITIWDISQLTLRKRITLGFVVEMLKLPLHFGSLYFAHPKLCPAGTTVIFLLRQKINKYGDFFSWLLMYDLKRDVMQLLNDSGEVSHYAWKSPSVFWCYCKNHGNAGLWEYVMDTKGHMIPSRRIGLVSSDTHPSFNRTGDWVALDSYPTKNREQVLQIAGTSTLQVKQSARFYSPLTFDADNRCDLHPRWSPDSRYVAVDSAASGFRRLCIWPTDIEE